ncbi:MAG: ABC transporter ATP-binding protein [Planctomycetes bacterium]|nr:ABC transporter ATP-binding protein [Planctomycetota bacterium]
MERTPRVGPGRFQWNQAGWFGAQIGSSLWLLITAAIMFARDWRLGLLTLACFLAPNIVGTMLWRRRDRIAPYPAIQIMLATLAGAAVLAVVVLHAADHLQYLDPRLGSEAWYLALLVIPAMMIAFHAMERAGERRRVG